MSASTLVPARSQRLYWTLLIPALVALAYGGGHLAWYRETPLGQVPVLDEMENLDLAEAIFRDNLPREPFYRALGYSLGLAALRALGLPPEGLFQAALFVGIVAHAVNATLVAAIARRLYAGNAGLIAGILYALHPVLVHYSSQALDAVPALTLFLLGVWSVASALSPAPKASARATLWALASLSWAVSAMMRPNYLLGWCALPLLAWIMGSSGRKPAVLIAALSGSLVFGAVAIWQWRVSGEAGFLPWQGSYNLWAANQPGTHGRYYVQQHSLPASVAKLNPARADSMYLYHRDKGSVAPDIRTLNAHWRARFLARLREQPVDWLVLLVRKSYALVNNWEQYNNKTFAFHKARSPWLRWNPICWGVVLVFGVAGLARLARETPAMAQVLGVLLMACAASAILYFVSARFRLPLAALATVLAGGALAAPRFWCGWPRRQRWGLAGALAATAVVTFSSFDRVQDPVTYVQDHALLARAADTVGDDLLAWQEANAALALQPLHRDALRLAVASYFNRLVLKSQIPGAEARWREVCVRFLGLQENDVRDLQAVAALALWRAGQTDEALRTWRQLGATPSALAARLLLDDVSPTRIDFSSWRGDTWREPLVRLAALRFSLPAPHGLELGDPVRARVVTQRIFSPASSAEPPQ